MSVNLYFNLVNKININLYCMYINLYYSLANKKQVLI